MPALQTWRMQCVADGQEASSCSFVASSFSLPHFQVSQLKLASMPCECFSLAQSCFAHPIQRAASRSLAACFPISQRRSITTSISSHFASLCYDPTPISRCLNRIPAQSRLDRQPVSSRRPISDHRYGCDNGYLEPLQHSPRLDHRHLSDIHPTQGTVSSPARLKQRGRTESLLLTPSVSASLGPRRRTCYLGSADKNGWLCGLRRRRSRSCSWCDSSLFHRNTVR